MNNFPERPFTESPAQIGLLYNMWRFVFRSAQNRNVKRAIVEHIRKLHLLTILNLVCT
jgi:hypothetical protein